MAPAGHQRELDYPVPGTRGPRGDTVKIRLRLLVTNGLREGRFGQPPMLPREGAGGIWDHATVAKAREPDHQRLQRLLRHISTLIGSGEFDRDGEAGGARLIGSLPP